MKRGSRNGFLVLGLFAAALSQPAVAWQPLKPVELMVPAASGSGADRMAKLIVQVVKQHKLMSVPLYVTNKAGGLGAAAYLDLKAARGDANKLVLALSSVFTTPHITDAGFDVQEFTPVAMLARTLTSFG